MTTMPYIAAAGSKRRQVSKEDLRQNLENQYSDDEKSRLPDGPVLYRKDIS